MPFLPQFISLYVVTCTTKIISLVCLQSFWAVACLVVSRPYVRTLFSELWIRRGSWLWPPTQKSVMDLRTSLCGVVVFTYGLLHCPDFWPRKSFWYVAELSFCSSWMNRLSQTLIFVFSLCASTVQKHPQRVSWFTKMLYMGHINIIMFMRGPSHTRRKTLIKREPANRNSTDYNTEQIIFGTVAWMCPKSTFAFWISHCHNFPELLLEVRKVCRNGKFRVEHLLVLRAGIILDLHFVFQKITNVTV